jgi:hypothetical protein
MLRYFAFFDLLSEGRTIAGSVAACATDFLCSFCHDEQVELMMVEAEDDLATTSPGAWRQFR